MTYNFREFKTAIAENEEWLKKELMNVQTGRATPAILDSISIDSYGSKMAVNQVASVTTEDARTLRVVPWETDNIRALEVAIRDADLGLSVSVDEKGVRVAFPELTTETREKYVKIVKTKLEDARVSLRGLRDDVWDNIQKQQKDGDISEDDKFRFKDEMEKLAKAGNDALDQLSDRKEKEVMQ